VLRRAHCDWLWKGATSRVARVVHFIGLNGFVQPDPATAAAALQTGEVDWVELPLIDLLPMLKQSSGVEVKVYDPFGWMGVLALNHLYPPFDNVKRGVRCMPAVDQHSSCSRLSVSNRISVVCRWATSPMARRWPTRLAWGRCPAHAISHWRRSLWPIRLR
jgi:hypothetical protein